MSMMCNAPAFAMKEEPKVNSTSVSSVRSLVEPTCTPSTNTLPLSRPRSAPALEVSALTLRDSIFTSSPEARSSKLAHLMFEPPSMTFEEGEFAAFATETEAEPIVCTPEERAENALPAAVESIGWLSSVSITRASAARRSENCLVRLEPPTTPPTSLMVRPPVARRLGAAERSHATDVSPAERFATALPTWTPSTKRRRFLTSLRPIEPRLRSWNEVKLTARVPTVATFCQTTISFAGVRLVFVLGVVPEAKSTVARVAEEIRSAEPVIGKTTDESRSPLALTFKSWTPTCWPFVEPAMSERTEIVTEPPAGTVKMPDGTLKLNSVLLTPAESVRRVAPLKR